MCEGAVQRVAKAEGSSTSWKPQTKLATAMDTPGQKAAGSKAGKHKHKHRLSSPFFLTWRPAQAWRIAKAHPLLVFLTLNFILVIPLEYTLSMVPQGGEPYDAGFVVTEAFHRLLKRRPALNHVLAAANTVLVVFQIGYIAWVWVVEGRYRPTLASIIMYSSRGFLGWSTQLPVPRDFLGSEVDFPVGNASFFLFFSGHVGASIIAALDFRRVGRMRAALVMDVMNVAQTVRLLATRGHYTIDLVSGAVGGWACYHLAGLYEQGMQKSRGLYDQGTQKYSAMKAAQAGGGGSDHSNILERKDSLLESDSS